LINTTWLVCQLGDDSRNRQYRTILHFNTSRLPDDATITKVMLQYKQHSITGSNPYASHGRVWADIKKGFFSNNPGLVRSDFAAAASLNFAGFFKYTPSSLKYKIYRANLKSSAFKYINLAGTTQFRLRFAKDDDNDSTADFIKIFCGNMNVPFNRPVLRVWYYTPVAVPTNLSATAVSQTQINLSWTDNATDETEYQVYRSPDGYNHWTKVATLAADTTTYSDTTLHCNYDYIYKVIAHRSTDNVSSAPSNTAGDTTYTCSYRTGGWADAINMSVLNPDLAAPQIVAGTIDIFAGDLVNPTHLDAIASAGLDHSDHKGIYYDLTLNPAGPVFTGTGKLNPFASATIREAMNWLIDRNYLNTNVYGGYSTPKWVSMRNGFPDHTRYLTEIQAKETYYTYNQTLAETTIATEMANLGATKVGDKWQYQSEDVILIFLIRNDSDGTRLPMGNKIADWLEAIGFTVTRQYGTSSELAPIWIWGDPDDGLWHLYTGAWGGEGVSRDDGDHFRFFFTQDSAYNSSPLWASYNVSATDLLVANALADRTYADWAARDVLFSDALDLMFAYNYRIWLIDGNAQSPWKTTLDVSYDLAGGVALNELWPHTLRYEASAGGIVDWANYDLFANPVNPVAGSGWTYDWQWQLATSDWDAIPDPNTGLPLAQRLASAAVVVETGLPVSKTHSWVTLSFQPTITVPTDAWVDWNATTQKFITAGTAHPGGLNAKTKVTLTYPSDLWHIKWHDGSPLTMADFLMALIVEADRSKPASPIYDDTYDGGFPYKAVKILTEDPLVVEIYSDNWYLDAEQIAVANRAAFWPEYGTGQAPWHVIAVSSAVEVDGNLAYSADKADDLGINWTNYLNGPSLTFMSTKLNTLKTSSYIPYAPTLGSYITSAEAAMRYTNLQAHYAIRAHFWLGTGPYMLTTVNWSGKTLTLVDFPDFIDPSDKWDTYNSP
jgi:peptide/nickel transport system substrate-binding protein